MGINLTIAVDPYNMGTPYGNQQLSFRGRYYSLWSDLEKAADPIPAIWWYKDKGLEKVTHNPYGSPILQITAGDMLKLIDQHEIPEKAKWDLAVVAFIRALPEDTDIYLWFH